MSTKQCTRCHAQRPVEDFYARQAQCKPCIRAGVNARRLTLEATDPAWAEREAARHRAKSERYRKAGRVTTSPAKMRALRKNWETLHPNQKIANTAVSNALRHGKLKREPCEICCDTRVEAHHEDYSKPLEVRWLCKAHHMARHVEINSERRLARFATRSE
jgi:hypothetical protein